MKTKYLLITAIFALALFSCKTLPQPTNSHHMERDSARIEFRTDTIIRDRWHTEKQKGDTLLIHDSIFIRVYKHDSIYVDVDKHITDTIYETVEVEKKCSVFLRGSGIALWVMIGLLFIALIIKVIIKYRD